MSWTHLGDTKPKARKRYHCDLCNLPIDVGTVHIARRGINDDVPITMRMHLRCEEITRLKKWDDAYWESNDASEFRKNLKRYDSRTIQSPEAQG